MQARRKIVRGVYRVKHRRALRETRRAAHPKAGRRKSRAAPGKEPMSDLGVGDLLETLQTKQRGVTETVYDFRDTAERLWKDANRIYHDARHAYEENRRRIRGAFERAFVRLG